MSNSRSEDNTHKEEMQQFSTKDVFDVLCRNFKNAINGLDYSFEPFSLTQAFEIVSRRRIAPLYSEAFANDKMFKSITNYIGMKSVEAYDILYRETVSVDKALKNAGIEACVIKGIDAASYYPNPKLRNFGDIDLYIKNTDRLGDIEKLFANMGYLREQSQNSPHHIAYINDLGVEVELHIKPNRSFENVKLNRAISEIFESDGYSFVEKNIGGENVRVLPDAMKALYFLVHMAQHFAYAGFGIKLIFDWALFWHECTDASVYKEYMDLTQKCGLRTFSDNMESLMRKFFGEDFFVVNYDAVGLDEEFEFLLIDEIISAGAYGESSSERMVNASNPTLTGLFKAFHNQMKDNYPNASKCFVTWPVLWVATYARFAKNNKTVRNTSTKAVLDNARKRSRLYALMKL